MIHTRVRSWKVRPTNDYKFESWALQKSPVSARCILRWTERKVVGGKHSTLSQQGDPWWMLCSAMCETMKSLKDVKLQKGYNHRSKLLLQLNLSEVLQKRWT